MESPHSTSYAVRTSSATITGVARIVAPITKEEQERTRINKKLFLEILERAYGNISMACQKTDIARSTVYHWRETDPAFRKAVGVAVRVRVDVAEDRIFSIGMAGDGNVDALKFVLKHKHPVYKRQRKGPAEVHIYHHRGWGSGDSGKAAPTLDDLMAADDAKEDAKETLLPLDKPIQEAIRREESGDSQAE